MTKLDEKGRCCGRKPLVYKNHGLYAVGHKFCSRCDRSFDLETDEQIENWAWVEMPRGSKEFQAKHHIAMSEP